MKFGDLKMLADENISPKAVSFLRQMDTELSIGSLIIADESQVRIRQPERLSENFGIMRKPKKQ